MKKKKRAAPENTEVRQASRPKKSRSDELLPAQCPLCHSNGGRPQLCEFTELSKGDLQISHVQFDRHQSIAREGDRVKSYYVIRSGWGGAYRASYKGQFMRLLLPGDLIAFEAIGQQTWPFHVRSLTPLLACALDSKMLSNALATNPSAYLPSLLQLWAQHSRDQYGALFDLSTGSAAKRLLSFLSHIHSQLHARIGISGLDFPFPLSRADVAVALGMAPVHVSRMINELRRLNIVDVTYGRVFILDQSRFVGA